MCGKVYVLDSIKILRQDDLVLSFRVALTKSHANIISHFEIKIS